MITNTGKEILAKYLMGVAPAYASYLAIGCGPKPRLNINSITNASTSGLSTTVTCTSTTGLWVGASVYHVTAGTGAIPSTAVVASIISSTQFTLSIAPTVALSGATVIIEIDKDKQSLDFEMFRLPISSRGYVNDGTYDKIVFTAELPTEERYEISEIGLYSAGSNPSAGLYDSKTLYAFTDAENWQLNDSSTSTLSSPVSITSSIIDGSNVITSTASAIQTLSNNTGFLNATRAARYERCRYFNNVIMLRGNNSYLSNTAGIFGIGTNSKFLQLTGQSVDFTRNSTSDLIKVAFSIVNVYGSIATNPDSVRVLIEFSSSDGTQYARMNAETTATANSFSTNRYMVVSKRLDALTYSGTFSWNSVSVIKIYVSAINNYTITTKAFSAPYVTLTTSATHNLQAGDIVKISGLGTGYDGQFTIYDTPASNTFRYAYTTTPGTGATGLTQAIEAASSKYFVALDAIRFDNIGTINPLYGMTGYTIVQDLTTTGATAAQTIIKSSNSNNYIEYRLIVDVT
jgi:hypothetical protein